MNTKFPRLYTSMTVEKMTFKNLLVIYFARVRTHPQTLFTHVSSLINVFPIYTGRKVLRTKVRIEVKSDI